MSRKSQFAREERLAFCRERMSYETGERTSEISRSSKCSKSERSGGKEAGEVTWSQCFCWFSVLSSVLAGAHRILTVLRVGLSCGNSPGERRSSACGRGALVIWRHVGFLTRDWTVSPSIGAWDSNWWTAREGPGANSKQWQRTCSF